MYDWISSFIRVPALVLGSFVISKHFPVSLERLIKKPWFNILVLWMLGLSTEENPWNMEKAMRTGIVAIVFWAILYELRPYVTLMFSS